MHLLRRENTTRIGGEIVRNIRVPEWIGCDEVALPADQQDRRDNTRNDERAPRPRQWISENRCAQASTIQQVYGCARYVGLQVAVVMMIQAAPLRDDLAGFGDCPSCPRFDAARTRDISPP